MMKILHVYPLPPIRSGITDYAQILQEALKVNKRIKIETFHGVGRNTTKNKGLKDLWYIWRNVRNLRKRGLFNRYDIVWIEAGRHNAFELVVGFLVSICLSDARLVITVHDPPHLCKSIVGYFRVLGIVHTGRTKAVVDALLEKLIVKRSSLIFTLSKKGKTSFLERFPGARKKISVLPHVAYEASEVIQRKSDIIGTGVQTHGFCFKTFGFLSKNKGADILFRALRKFLNRTPVIHDDPVLIFASGAIDNASENTYMEELRQLISDLGLDEHVRFTGYIPHDELSDFLNSPSIFVIPYSKTFNYSSSGVLMRVLTAGAPVIASDVNTLGELIEDGMNGFLVKPGDVDAVAGAMLKLYTDPGLRISMRKKSLEYVLRNHSWEVVEEKVWEELGTSV